MADSKIEWTERTWNPIVGCAVVSPGCTNCYAMKMAGRLEAMAARPDGTGNAGLAHYVGTTRSSRSGFVWSGAVNVAPDSILTAPLRRRKPTTWFVNSMADLFHEEVADDIIDRVFAVMRLCPQHRFQVLTKRSKRMRAYFASPGDRFTKWTQATTDAMLMAALPIDAGADRIRKIVAAQNLENVWLGVSVEDQARADERIPDLLATPAAVRFLSCEPLLGPVDLGQFQEGLPANAWLTWLDGLDWVIVGGESGPGARPMHPDWARSLRDQCRAAGVPFFFKQWGEWLPVGPLYDDEGYTDEVGAAENALQNARGKWFADSCQWWTDARYLGLVDSRMANWANEECQPPADCVVIRRAGKKHAGRLLDGREWSEFPA